MLKKIISILFLFFLFFIKLNASTINISSDKYILYNLTDDNILLEKKSHEKAQIASLTKIMTIIVAIENINNYDEKVQITKEMIKDLTWDIAKLGFKEKEVYTYNDLLYAANLPSAADAVNALAISISGSYEEYLKLMNRKCLELGLIDTHFSNVIGLTDENNYSSAYDIANLVKYALKNNKFKEIFMSKEYTLSNGRKIKSTISKYNNNYIDGSKTGYTNSSGRCMASISNINGVQLLFVSLNNYQKNTSYITDTIELYKHYENNYSYKDIISDKDIIKSIDTSYSKQKKYDIKVDKIYMAFLDNNFNKKNIKYEYEGIDNISFFTKKGKIIGNVKVIYNDEIIKKIDIFYDGSLKFSLLRCFAFYLSIFVIIVVIFIYKKFIK